MKLLDPTRHPRLKEAVAVVFLLAGLFFFFSLASYHPFDPSLNTASEVVKPGNLTGRTGAFLADFLLQAFGLGAYAIPILIFWLSLKLIWSSTIDSVWAKLLGATMLIGATCTALGLFSNWRPIAGIIPAGGLVGSALADSLVGSMNLTGAILATAACWICSIYLVSTFEMSRVPGWFRGPIGWGRSMYVRFQAWREERARRARLQAQARAIRKTLKPEKARAAAAAAAQGGIPIVDPLAPPEPRPGLSPKLSKELDDIPIRALEFNPPAQQKIELVPAPEQPPAPVPALSPRRMRESSTPRRTEFRQPPTDLLQEAAARTAYDSQELKETAALIKSKFQEFNVLGSVVQINPGPVLTNF